MGQDLSPLVQSRTDAAIPGRAPGGSAGVVSAGHALTILVVDDHALVRHGLALSVAEFYPEARILEAGSLRSAIDCIHAACGISLVLYDLHLDCDVDGNEDGGVEGLQRMLAELGNVPLIVVSGAADLRSVVDSIRAGARGYVLKSCSSEVLEHALSLVLSGETYVPLPRTVLAGSIAIEQRPPVNRLLDRLTDRQRDVFRLVLAGRSNKEIARSLGVLEGTVKVHVRAIMQKLGVKNRTQVAVAAARAGWLPDDA